MLYAIQNGEKVESHPHAKAKCPLCERQVYSKCGDINVWHWAHEKGDSCDGGIDWNEPETEWHKNWKLVFGKECSEITIERDGVRHRADVKTKTDKSEVIIELQNSPISQDTIKKREAFYGKNMLWIINGASFKNNFSIIEYDDFDDDEDYAYKALTTSNWNQFTFFWNWQYARRSWEVSKRNIFIDFGEDYLFWVKFGLFAVSSGQGKKVPKACFIKKYVHL